MWRGCQRTHQAYPEQLGNCPLVVSEEGSEDLLMERFAHLVSHEYAPVGSLGSGAMDLEGLKRYLSVSECDFAEGSKDGGKGGGDEHKMTDGKDGGEEEKVLEPDDVLI